MNPSQQSPQRSILFHFTGEETKAEKPAIAQGHSSGRDQPADMRGCTLAPREEQGVLAGPWAGLISWSLACDI